MDSFSYTFLLPLGPSTKKRNSKKFYFNFISRTSYFSDMSRLAVEDRREEERKDDEGWTWTEGGKQEISEEEILAVLRECDIDTAPEKEGGKPLGKASIDDLNYIIERLEEQVAALERQLQHSSTQTGAMRMLINCLDLGRLDGENRQYFLNFKTQLLHILNRRCKASKLS